VLPRTDNYGGAFLDFIEEPRQCCLPSLDDFRTIDLSSPAAYEAKRRARWISAGRVSR
jgi:hypothetical protein